eukprot:s2074_g4.t1
MPPGPICVKCRQIAPSEGDSWCSGCSSWEFLGRELTAAWDSQGARLLASDLVVNAARQVRALRSLSAGLARSGSQVSAGVSLAEAPATEPKRRSGPRTAPREDHRASLPRRRASATPQKPVAKTEVSEDEGGESEEEERDPSPAKSPDHKPLGGGLEQTLVITVRRLIRILIGAADIEIVTDVSGESQEVHINEEDESIRGEMGSFVNGQEVDVDDSTAWTTMQPVPGIVAEVSLTTSSLGTAGDDWAAFYVMEVDTLMDGSMVLQCHYLGCTDPDIAADLIAREGAGVTPLHLCLSRPCVQVEPIEGLHITTVRWWELEKFKECDYVVSNMWKKAAKWEKELQKQKEPAKRRDAGTKPSGRPGGAGKAAAAPKRRGRKTEEPPERGLPEDMRAKLRGKLDEAKRGVRAARGETSKAVDVEDSEDEEYPSSPSAETGPPALQDAPPTKDISTKSLSGQLTRKAVQVAREQKKRSKKSKGKKSGQEVMKVLAKMLTKSSQSKESSEKKDKKRKKRKRKIQDDGTIRSCSSSSGDSSSEGAEDDESETDLEAPIKKRSRDKPGSVLAMLVGHVREQLEQASLTELPEGEQLVTGGVKLSTYFALQIKPAHPTHLRELREMHSLAATIDLLRRGDVARVGDSLAARFMALHQAILDNNWNTAKYMELHTMDEASAGSAAIVLASRKHSRLVDRVQGKGGGSWSSWGWTSKGRGKGNWRSTYETPQKGEKGKGKEKGKKGKGKNQSGPSWDEKTAEWGKSKESAADK